MRRANTKVEWSFTRQGGGFCVRDVFLDPPRCTITMCRTVSQYMSDACKVSASLKSGCACAHACLRVRVIA